jgi:hypothetical protein
MVGTAGGWCGSENRFFIVPSLIAFWLNIFAPVYVSYCILHRWKHRSVSLPPMAVEHQTAHAPVAEFWDKTSW